MLSFKNLLTDERITKLLPWLKVSGIALLILILLLAAVLSLHSGKQIQLSASQLHIDQKQALTQLNRIENHITQLNNHIDKTSIPHEEIQALNQQLATIQNNIDTLNKQTDKTRIQQTLAEENQKLIEKLNSIQNRLDLLKKVSQSNKKLSSKMLPFRIMGIDIWNGQPMATVHIGNDSDLMAISETRAGWTLIDIDFSASQVIFKSPQNEYLRIKV